MLHNIDINKMNQLMERDRDAKEIIGKLLENHQMSISTIGHELRNPLTLVYSALQITQIHHPEVKEFTHWGHMLEDVHFMIKLLDELSSFNNGERLRYSTFYIAEILRGIAISFAISMEQSPEIEFASYVDPNVDDFPFTGDLVKMREVILNLLRNAKDAVAARLADPNADHKRGRMRMEARRQPEGIVIKVIDNGCGIKPERMEKIFEPFVTYKEDGTGLGLAISKRIIESHRGTLTVTSGKARNTVFTIVIQ